MPLAGGFLKEEEIADEQKYPLDISFCENCTLLQVPVVIAPEVLFKDYFYFSSAIGTLVEHCGKWAKDTFEMYLKDKENPSVFELGCNDGVMLKPFAALGVKAVGVDPASNVVASVKQEGFTIVDAFFSDEVAEKIEADHGKFDVITSSYSFAHIDNMASVLAGIKRLLKPDGVFQVEVYYLGTTMEEMQYDMIYHEHCNYYSLSALENFFASVDMEICDVDFTPGVRSGAARFTARHKGGRKEPISENVIQMRKDELEKGYGKKETFEAYGSMIQKTKDDMMNLLTDLKAQGKTIIGYGASGRGTMVMNYCGIDGSHLDYVVDDAPAKHGFFTPGTHVKIEPWERTMQGEAPDYAVLFAWSFKKEVLAKREEYVANGGKFIVPLPEVSVEPADK
jgi:methylation protein EvaC